ncbi:MAG TPA: 50S ribosomal protein L21 [Bacteroidota bacterium]|nr:50S ribosomal protein L21 [Bacteroidota bacterium]
MFAVVEVAGQQLKVSPAEQLYVPRLAQSVGDTVTFDRVILLSDDKKVSIGAPYVKNASVKAKILGHVKDETVIVFKKKKRKGYRLRRGHRQQYTQVEITKIAS